ncbi:MAG: CheY-like chemotaxis protein [Phenylobacterium sp.]|jgi:CheY-like chemotaxis protein
MEGEIGLRSQVGQGSVFSVCLELPIDRTLADQPIEHLADSSSEKPACQFDARVLLVEDTPFNQLIATTLLENLGVTVTLAEDGQQAIEVWSEQSFDLILMDYHMNVMDGLEATRQIRCQEQPDQRIPIICQTADISEAFVNKSQLAGMDDCIVKPFGEEQLTEVLSKWIGE